MSVPYSTKTTWTTNWHGLPALLGLSSYVANHHLAGAPHSGAKYEFYCTVQSITLKSTCKAHRVSNVEDRVRSQN